jgi:hypothetical protein
MNRVASCFLSLAFLFFPLTVHAQATVKEKDESGLASGRIIAARRAARAVTVQQCLADLSSWEAKDEADEKAKVESPDFWYAKLSTEELVRLSAESSSCSSVLRHAHRLDNASMMPLWGRMFENELLGRAEAILAEHYLMQEYLLQSSPSL